MTPEPEGEESKPCVEETPPSQDPRNSVVSIQNGVFSIEYKGQQVVITLRATAIPPTA
jgi:hypothetical protein